MNNEYDQVIKSHYDTVAAEEKDTAASTMASLFVRDAETTFITNMISKFLDSSHSFKIRHSRLSKSKKDEASKVLDVGCGNGYTIGKLARSFPELCFTGLELTDSLREVAKGVTFQSIG